MQFELFYENECWKFETEHLIDPDTRQLFQDLITKNEISWTDKDIEYFLETKGTLHTCKITKTLSEKYIPTDTTDAFACSFPAEVKKVIICIYSSNALSTIDVDRIMQNITNPLPNETIILWGWIIEEEYCDNYTVKIIFI